MAMNFTPKSETEIKKEEEQRSVWPRGQYDFEVVNYSDEVSKNGNDMIKLQLRVYHPDGGTRTIFDYLMPAIAAKLRHACDCMGLTDRYESGQLEAQDFDGGVGKLILYIKKGTGGYADQNAVADYVKAEANATRAERPTATRTATGGGGRKAQSDIDDEIPFAAQWQ